MRSAGGGVATLMVVHEVGEGLQAPTALGGGVRPAAAKFLKPQVL